MQTSREMRLSHIWQRLTPTRNAPPPSQSAARQALRMLVYLRFFTPAAQAATLVLVHNFYEVEVPFTAIIGLIAAEVVIAALTCLRLRSDARISQTELFAQAALEVALFAVMLYLTGGATNPFAPLFLVPMVIVGSALEQRRVWALALATIAAYIVVRQHNVPLWHPQGHTQVFELHEDGMVINYVFTALLLTYFANHMNAEVRLSARRLADARDTQMRNDAVVAIGALAAGCAHQLSSPLATIAVVVAEMKRERGDNANKDRELELLEKQIAACKQIVSNLASAGGQRRAEAAAGARVDQFLAAAIEAVRALNPGATIHASIEGATPAPMIVAEETLRQAIMNLVQNAAQASPHFVQVRADWGHSDLVFDVQDNGPGVPTHVLAALGSKVGSIRGSADMGPSLLMSAATLESLGGRLEVANMPAGGAHAKISLPLASILLDPGKRSGDGNAYT